LLKATSERLDTIHSHRPVPVLAESHLDRLTSHFQEVLLSCYL
jgi:hypothetical protein